MNKSARMGEGERRCCPCLPPRTDKLFTLRKHPNTVAPGHLEGWSINARCLMEGIQGSEPHKTAEALTALSLTEFPVCAVQYNDNEVSLRRKMDR